VDANEPRLAREYLAYRERRGGVRVYFCCCPLTLFLALPLLLARLCQYALGRLRGRSTLWV